MNILLTILFAITLIYLSITERFRIFANLIGIQGTLLFLLSFLEANVLTIGNLLFIVTETLLFKVIIVPYFLYKIINKTGIARVHEKALPGFYSLLFVSLGLLLSIIVAWAMKTKPINITYFIVSFFALYTGLFLIISHKKIFSHLIGFLVIENSVLLLSLSIGADMPMLINIGILLDLFVSVLILGIFSMRMKQHSHQLTMLKDD
jgi:hydrogenase-4 component E